jgi:hypothetical protein
MNCGHCGAECKDENIKGEIFSYKKAQGIPLTIDHIASRCQNPECREVYLKGYGLKELDEALEAEAKRMGISARKYYL